MCEIWKDIPGYEGIHQVSTKGRMRSLPFRDKNGNLRSMRYRRPTANNYGYMKVTLIDKENESIHRLVALTFLGRSDLTVDHVNGIKSDNRLSNLRYITRRENICAYHGKEPPKYKGTHKRKDSGRWEAIISVNGRAYKCGKYKTELEAHTAYEKAMKDWTEHRKLPERKHPKGYYYDKRSGKYVAEKIINRKKHWIGMFESAEDASRAYKDFKLCS